MKLSESSWWPSGLFPRRRFDPDFPLVYWFVGLWLYLKSFLYFCYVYMLGIEPPPYSTTIIMETAYFGLAMVPSFFLAALLWRERHWALVPAIIFLVIDTPVLLLHVMRLAEAGFLESGLTEILEFGSLGLNLLSLGWLIGYRSMAYSAKSS